MTRETRKREGEVVGETKANYPASSHDPSSSLLSSHSALVYPVNCCAGVSPSSFLRQRRLASREIKGVVRGVRLDTGTAVDVSLAIAIDCSQYHMSDRQATDGFEGRREQNGREMSVARSRDETPSCGFNDSSRLTRTPDVSVCLRRNSGKERQMGAGSVGR